MICQLVLEYFQLQLSDILFFLEAFGLFGIFWPSKGLTAFLRPKNPKKASGLQKKQNVFKLQLKILQKKLTHHEKMPAFFLSLVPYHIDAHSSMILYIAFSIFVAFRSGKKVKKRPSSGQKRLKNGLQGTEKRKCFRHQFKKMPQKTQLTPKTIFLSIFIFCRTNVRDIYHIVVGKFGCFGRNARKAPRFFA